MFGEELWKPGAGAGNVWEGRELLDEAIATYVSLVHDLTLRCGCTCLKPVAIQKHRTRACGTPSVFPLCGWG